jgi:uncharacterized membrane protein YfcA
MTVFTELWNADAWFVVFAVVSGGLVGLSLGLTGGGGAMLAVPLLVYGLAVESRSAVAMSLLSVGVTAVLGTILRARQHQVEWPTGLVFAVAGMMGAPLGSWLGQFISETVLLTLFAGLMLLVAEEMWRKSHAASAETLCPIPPRGRSTSTCQRDSEGQLHLTSRCAALLLAVGILSGVLSGLFGIGGGFIIVPALILFSSMPIRRAVGTSLLVISLVSVSGVATQLRVGTPLPMEIALPFVIGSFSGLILASTVSHRLAGPTLQRGFAAVIVVIAVGMLTANLLQLD